MPKELNLTNLKTEILRVAIGDKTYDIPLATSLPYKEAKKLLKAQKAKPEESIDMFIAFFSNYIDSEVLETLPINALVDLAKAWSGKSEDDETSLGES